MAATDTQAARFVHCVETADFFWTCSHSAAGGEEKSSGFMAEGFLFNHARKRFWASFGCAGLVSSLSMELPLTSQESFTERGMFFLCCLKKLPSYLEFCRQANGEYLYRFQEAISRLWKWGRSNHFLSAHPRKVVVYQKGVQFPLEHHHGLSCERFAEQFPACQWLTNCLTTYNWASSGGITA